MYAYILDDYFPNIYYIVTIAPTEAPAPEVCFDVKTVTKKWGNEISWEIGCKDSACRECESNLDFGNNEEYTQECCLPRDQEEFVINCKDSWGDGWHGGYLEINENKYCADFSTGKEQQEQMPNEAPEPGLLYRILLAINILRK